MLTALSIRDVVLIERLELSFGPGLTALTGQTGAGKSILLDSLGLALGSRADAGLVREGAEQASVMACFAPPPGHPVGGLLAEHELAPAEEELVLRRVITKDGRSRAFVNDEPVSVGLLRRIGALLVEVQGRAVATIVRGNVVMQDGELVADAPLGKWVYPNAGAMEMVA